MSEHLDFRWEPVGSTDRSILRVWCHDGRVWCDVVPMTDGTLCCERCWEPVDRRLAIATRSAYRHR